MKENKTSGGGYINDVSVAKSKAIKTPLHLYNDWNTKVNKCNTLEELKKLIKNN